MTDVESILPSVVAIHAGGRTCGAGVVFGGGPARTVIVTNAHVVAGAGMLRVAAHDGAELDARLVLRDEARDVAVLETVGALPGARTARPGDPATMRAGHVVVAVGHPGGLRDAITTGVLHSLGPLRGPVPLPERVRRLPWVQADVRLAPGNSGGPLCDVHGRVLGINTLVVGGLGLAVPVGAVGPYVRAAA